MNSQINNFSKYLGIDLKDATKLFQDLADLPDVARKCKALEKTITQYQDSFTAIEQVQISKIFIYDTPHDTNLNACEKSRCCLFENCLCEYSFCELEFP